MPYAFSMFFFFSNHSRIKLCVFSNHRKKEKNCRFRFYKTVLQKLFCKTLPGRYLLQCNLILGIKSCMVFPDIIVPRHVVFTLIICLFGPTYNTYAAFDVYNNIILKMLNIYNLWIYYVPRISLYFLSRLKLHFV